MISAMVSPVILMLIFCMMLVMLSFEAEVR